MNRESKYGNNYQRTQLERICNDKGESIEEMLRRLTANKEPIPEDVPPIYTPKKDGVLGDYDIRHDRFDTAYEATDKYTASEIAKSANMESDDIDSAEAVNYEEPQKTE